jgi:hypothetical protein
MALYSRRHNFLMPSSVENMNIRELTVRTYVERTNQYKLMDFEALNYGLKRIRYDNYCLFKLQLLESPVRMPLKI